MTSQSLTDSVAQQRLDWSLPRVPVTVVDLSGSDSDDSSSTANANAKRARVSSDLGVTSPPPPAPETPEPISVVPSPAGGWKQFWNAGDYEGVPGGRSELMSGGMDHVRVHPKFLHSNATSHKWALGAFAELVDNSLDEVCNGATLVNMDVLESKKDGSRMLMIEDNGGGMDPDRMRQCMSLGYSAKSKMANTIGQYGNGFKTSTMRLGADVIVFSRCLAKDGKPPCQSIGLLSYTFLRSTCKEDIVVPILDYQRRGREWTRLVRSSADWKTNVDTIVQWSPFSSEQDLFRQFNLMRDHGTRIIIYNLWEDDQGLLELDFDSDSHDIQLRGVNRDEKSIQMASQYPNSRHFLTYRHSLRSYASILYLRLPPGFRIILRGKDVEHHNLVNDMMMAEEKTYKPKAVGKDCAMVTIGFVKDAKHHIDVQGFNVYHKNRLIKPFWRLWNAAGSDGRGVIGVLEANFVEPAHDKQGFERTTVLARLEAKLIQMQKTYWSSLCHKIGYAPRRNKKLIDEQVSTPPESCQLKKNLRDEQVSPPQESGHLKRKLVDEQVSPLPESGHLKRRLVDEQVSPPQESCHLKRKFTTNQEAHKESQVQNGPRTPSNSAVTSDKQLSPSHLKDKQDCEVKRERNILQKEGLVDKECHVRDAEAPSVEQLKEENRELRERLEKRGETVTQLLQDLQYEKDGCRLLEMQIQEAQRKIEELNKEQESLIEIFSEERERREMEEENLRNKLKVASNTIQELLNKVDTK